MSRLSLSAIAFNMFVLTGSFAAAQDADAGAGAKSFKPLKHLPQQSVFVLSIDNIDRLKAKLSRTLWGRIFTHPGWREAVAPPLAIGLEKIAEQTDDVKALTGRSLLELAGLFRGRVTLAMRGIGPTGFPELILAIELGESKEDLLDVLSRLQTVFEAELGQKLQKRPVGSVEGTIWPTPGGPGPFAHAVIGGHLIFATSPDLLLAIDSAVAGGDGKAFEAGALHAELSGPLEVPGREVLLEVDLEAIRQLGMAFAGPEREQIQSFLKTFGVDKLSSFGYAMGFDGPASRGALHLGSRDGNSGILRLLENALPPVKSIDGVLERIPSGSNEVSAACFAPGKLVTGIDSLLRSSIPEIAESLDLVYEGIEEASGLSVKDDLAVLPPVTVHSFSVEPPLGGLIADNLALVRSDELKPYWGLLEKVAEGLGATKKTVDAGGKKVEYLNLAGGWIERGGILGDLLDGDVPGLPRAGAAESLMLATAGFPAVSRHDLGDGWTVVSASTVAVRRYVTHYSKGPHLSESPELAAFARSKIVGASSAYVFNGGRSILWLYNTVVSIGNALAAYGAFVGVDFARVPPAEEFLDAVGPGFFRLTVGDKGFTLQSQRGLESSSTVIIAAAVVGTAVAAGLMMPALTSGRSQAWQVMCTNNLKQLFSAMNDYAAVNNRYPSSDDGGLAALNKLLGSRHGRFLPAEIFVCPGGFEVVCGKAPGKPLVLSDDCCSYEIASWPTKPTKLGILAWDRDSHHDSGRMVLFTDGSVRVMDEFSFQRELEKHRK